MYFTAVEIIALVLIAFAVIKIFVLLVKPKAWMKFARTIYKKPSVTSFIAFLLAGWVFYYLISAGISIVTILSVTAFTALMLVIGLAGNAKALIRKYEDEIKEGKIWKKYWFYTLLWVALFVWGVLVLFNVI